MQHASCTVPVFARQHANYCSFSVSLPGFLKCDGRTDVGDVRRGCVRCEQVCFLYYGRVCQIACE